MHTYLHFFIFLYIDVFGAFLRVSLSPSLFLSVSCIMAPKRNPLRPRTLFILGNLLLLTLHLLMYSSVMIKPKRTFQRTFVDEAFIRNAKSSYRIFPILTYSLSLIIGVGSHCVAPWSLVLS